MHYTCAIITFVLFDYCQSQKLLLCSYQLSLVKISSMAPINLVIISICFAWASCIFSISSWLFRFRFLYQGSVGSSFSFSYACSPFHFLLNCLKCWQEREKEKEKECLMKTLLGLLCLTCLSSPNQLPLHCWTWRGHALQALHLLRRSAETSKWNHRSVFGSSLYTPCICPLNTSFSFCIFPCFGCGYTLHSICWWPLTSTFTLLLSSLSWYDTLKFTRYRCSSGSNESYFAACFFGPLPLFLLSSALASSTWQLLIWSVVM